MALAETLGGGGHRDAHGRSIFTVTRDVERELFPCLRRLSLRFVAYNPLAGGLLTGRYRRIEEVPAEGRFHAFRFYRDRYWSQAYFDALAAVRSACETEGVAMAAAGLRWIMHHSRMAGFEGDTVILGASTPAHLEANLAACAAGPLPESLITAIDTAWAVAKPTCPAYFR